MIDARGDRIQELFREALTLPRAERRSFLDSRSGGDAGVRAIVEALVEAHEESQTAGAGATAQGSSGHADPERVGPYRIARKIGEGGMGTVYVAEQTEPIRRTVALKVIKRGMDTEEVLARFEHERQSLALMNHAGIAQVHDAGATADGRPYFVMEHVPGLAVTEYCDRNQLAVPERIELFLDVCSAVQHAHQKGIIHRDLKPSNILVTLHDGLPLPKIIDFGLAKSVETRLTDRTVATRLGQIMGTPGYMSPEQMDIAAPDVDTRSDVYALGVILYELLVGVLPFDPESLHAAGYVEVQRMIREVEPPRPSTRFSMLNGASEVTARARGTDPRTLARHLRGDLDWIVMRCLEKDRARRYASASELAADLERHLDHEPVLAGPPSRAYRLKKFVRKNRGLVAATALVFAALTTGLAVASYGLVEANRHRVIAEGALVDTQHARDAEKERATQLQQVADFQGEQLSGIDAALMGIRLRKGLLDGVRAASERGRHTEEETAARVAEVEKLIAGANFTDLALASLDENIFERTLETIDKQFADQPLVRAQLLQSLAETLRELGLHEAAQDPQETALAIRSEYLGPEHPETLRALSKMGALLEARGKLAETESCYRKVLEARRRVLGTEHPDTLASVARLGSLLVTQGKLEEAEQYLTEALENQRRILGSNHSTALVTVEAMALLLESQGRLGEAEAYLRESLETTRGTRGDAHRSTAASMNNLGYVLMKQGKLAEAEHYFRTALDTLRQTSGNDHPNTLISIGNLGALLQSQGKFTEAEPYCREVLERMRRCLGSGHFDTVTAINNLGFLLMNQGRLAEAEPYFREALTQCRLVLGNEHPNTVTSVNNMGVLLSRQGNLAEAEPYLREALEARRRLLGDEHSDTLTTIHTMGMLLRTQGKLAEAEPLLQEALRTRRRVLGDGHPQTLISIYDVSTLLRDLGQLDDAETLGAEAVRRARESLPAGHWRIGVFLTGHGQALVVLKRYSEAAQDLEEGHAILAAGLGEKHTRTVAVVGYIISCYEKWHSAEPGAGHDLKAAEWRAKLPPEEAKPKEAAGD